MGGSSQRQAQATNVESKGVDEVAEQHPEAPIPLDKAAGEDAERRAPDLSYLGTGISGEGYNRRPLYDGL